MQNKIQDPENIRTESETLFKQYNEEIKNRPIEARSFKIGELIEIKNSIFKVQGIRPKKLILKLVTRK